MKMLQAELTSVAKTLTELSRQVVKISRQVEKISNNPSAFASSPGSGRFNSNQGPTLLDAVYDVIRRKRKGAPISVIKEKTQFDSRQISNALYKLTKRGKITTKSRGVYVKVPK
ncbi:MAG: hypothetical protein HKM93_18840 [Desulfobacteraceae bacterium]|nr:hypothetical protein [Desulfobacteraceae bacterium]